MQFLEAHFQNDINLLVSIDTNDICIDISDIRIVPPTATKFCTDVFFMEFVRDLLFSFVDTL